VSATKSIGVIIVEKPPVLFNSPIVQLPNISTIREKKHTLPAIKHGNGKSSIYR